MTLDMERIAERVTDEWQECDKEFVSETTDDERDREVIEVTSIDEVVTPEPITRTHVHAGTPEHRGTYQGVVNGMHAWRCSCGDTVFTAVVPPPRPDVFGRDWGTTNDEELCSTCGQPDNCGDCTHEPLTDADYRTLTMFDEPEGWDGSRPLQ